LVITSPSPSNPSTDMIAAAISSFDEVDGLQDAAVLIVLDGYKLAPESRTKKGRITTELALSYELYLQALVERYASPRFSVVRCKEHLGFAHAVKFGLELCSTPYAMVAQHDRAFMAPFPRLGDLLDTMEAHPHIRYIGFPTSNNLNHDKIVSENYSLRCLNQSGVKMHLGGDLFLQPAVFWFDSQHLCHVQRYLEIYTPFLCMPAHLRQLAGGAVQVKKLLLRRGDFIEDRFGQQQRSILCALARPGEADNGEEEIVDMFRWFGSYLCWQSSAYSLQPFSPLLSHAVNDTVCMVRHLRGRQTDSERMFKRLSGCAGAGAIVTGATGTGAAVATTTGATGAAADAQTGRDTLTEGADVGVGVGAGGGWLFSAQAEILAIVKSLEAQAFRTLTDGESNSGVGEGGEEAEKGEEERIEGGDGEVESPFVRGHDCDALMDALGELGAGEQAHDVGTRLFDNSLTPRGE